GGAEKHDHLALDHLDLRLQPRPARTDLAGVWLLMQPSLAAAGPAEMLDGVGHVDPATIDARLFQAFLQQPAGGADEGLALEVLLVAGLLADQHELRALTALAEDGLGGVGPQLAAPAGQGRLLQLLHAPGVLRRLRRHSVRTHESVPGWEEHSMAKGDFVEVLVDAGGG